MTAVSGAYDDGEDVPTPGDDMDDDQLAAIAAIRAVPDARIRRAIMAVFVLAVLHGRVGA